MEPPNEKDGKIAVAVANLIQNLHLSQRRLDDTVAPHMHCSS